MSQEVQASAEEPKRVIAVAVDESENAKAAFEFYISNVRREGDKIYLIHSVEINSVLHSTQWYSSPYQLDKTMLLKLLEEEKEKIKHKLEGFAEWLKRDVCDGVVKSIHAESPGQGICKAAEEIGANLIIIGTRGMGTLRRTFMGSVSDYVLHHAHVPVLICRHESDFAHQQQQQHDKKH